MDNEGNEVPEEQSKRTMISEYDENDNRVLEEYVIQSEETAEESEKYQKNFKYDPNSEILKNITYVKPENPFQHLVDEQKKRFGK